ncbi:MAG TPA: histidine kinase, partial [Candidatus Sulfotelmatobacter sp.]|nr:histidine kinase [Candidatus Sulfotelmatobacter sp.]
MRPRGRLTIFLGAAPGVGKTRRMLEAAWAHRDGGTAVVVGCADAHGNPELQSLLREFEALPSAGRGLDVDAALVRRPDLLLVDELARGNQAGARHAQRWQDVQELLVEGISIYTTLNVYQLESLKDLVAEITGVRIQATIPDSVFEQADEVELVDALPEAVLQRVESGQVTLPGHPPE